MRTMISDYCIFLMAKKLSSVVPGNIYMPILSWNQLHLIPPASPSKFLMTSLCGYGYFLEPPMYIFSFLASRRDTEIHQTQPAFADNQFSFSFPVSGKVFIYRSTNIVQNYMYQNSIYLQSTLGIADTLGTQFGVCNRERPQQQESFSVEPLQRSLGGGLDFAPNSGCP